MDLDETFEELRKVFADYFDDIKLKNHTMETHTTDIEVIFKNKEEARWFKENIVNYNGDNDKEPPIAVYLSSEPIGDIKGDYSFNFTLKNKQKLIELIKTR
jgi:hypothetical protein